MFRPSQLVAVPTEMEASLIVQYLEGRGIPALHVGAHITTVRPQLPGLVQVMVDRDDVERGERALRERDRWVGSLDWSTVDVGSPED